MMDVHVGYFISKVLLIALCIKGLRSDNHEIIKISLVRIQSFVFNDFMAGRFEQDDGVVMLVSLLGHHDVLADAGDALLGGSVYRCFISPICYRLTYSNVILSRSIAVVSVFLFRALGHGLQQMCLSQMLCPNAYQLYLT